MSTRGSEENGWVEEKKGSPFLFANPTTGHVRPGRGTVRPFGPHESLPPRSTSRHPTRRTAGFQVSGPRVDLRGRGRTRTHRPTSPRRWDGRKSSLPHPPGPLRVPPPGPGGTLDWWMLNRPFPGQVIVPTRVLGLGRGGSSPPGTVPWRVVERPHTPSQVLRTGV